MKSSNWNLNFKYHKVLTIAKCKTASLSCPPALDTKYNARECFKELEDPKLSTLSLFLVWRKQNCKWTPTKLKFQNIMMAT